MYQDSKIRAITTSSDRNEIETKENRFKEALIAIHTEISKNRGGIEIVEIVETDKEKKERTRSFALIDKKSLKIFKRTEEEGPHVFLTPLLIVDNPSLLHQGNVAKCMILEPAIFNTVRRIFGIYSEETGQQVNLFCNEQEVREG